MNTALDKLCDDLGDDELRAAFAALAREGEVNVRAHA